MYHERREDFPQDLAEHNAGDALGTVLFLLVDMAGANQSTPSGEGDPSTAVLTEYTVQYDSRVTGYASCDLVVGSADYRCACAHERQLNKSAACSLDSVGLVDLKPYYQAQKQTHTGSPAAQVRASAAGLGCNW